MSHGYVKMTTPVPGQTGLQPDRFRTVPDEKTAWLSAKKRTGAFLLPCPVVLKFYYKCESVSKKLSDAEDDSGRKKPLRHGEWFRPQKASPP